MPRVKTAVTKLRRKRRLLKRTKGYYGRRGNCHIAAMETRIRAEAFATTHRRLRKREMRALWILRINASCRAAGISYSKFINGLKMASVALDRRMLSEIAIRDAAGFGKLIDLAKSAG